MHTLTIIVSHTGTGVAKVIRTVTKGYYNHCSVALDHDFRHLYSFSRRYKKYWFTGCFTKENLEVLKDKGELKAVFYEIQLDEKDYQKVKRYIKELSKGYRIYNYLGAVMIVFNKGFPTKKYMLCSTFVAYLLSITKTISLDKPYYLYSPIDIKHLLDYSDAKKIIVEKSKK
jgi:hypothetical protein